MIQRVSRHHQRGVAALEFALVFLLGILPLFMLTLSGVLIFAAQQSLTLAASEGARAALHYGTTAQRQTAACAAAQASMQWLLTFSGESANCAAPSAPGSTYQPIAVSVPANCPSNAAMSCITVVTSYDYSRRPLIPLASAAFVWLTGPNLKSSATVQLDLSGSF